MKKVIADIEIGDLKISSASEMAEAFNCHFANIGHDLGRDIPAADTVPESYLISTNATFFLKVVAPMKSENYLKNRSLRGHVLTGNECYTINIVYVIVDMLL